MDFVQWIQLIIFIALIVAYILPKIFLYAKEGILSLFEILANQKFIKNDIAELIESIDLNTIKDETSKVDEKLTRVENVITKKRLKIRNEGSENYYSKLITDLHNILSGND